MHEMSITRSILDIVRREMERNHLTRLKSLKIRVGELTAVEPESLRFCFETSVKDTPWDGASLEIIEVPLAGRCSACGADFRIEVFSNNCPVCGGTEVERTSGTELDIISMEAV